MSAPRRARQRSATAFHQATVAFIYDAKESPLYPSGIDLLWHRFSLQKGHVHGRRGYCVRQACEAHGVDPDELYERITRPARESAERSLERTLRWWKEFKEREEGGDVRAAE